MMVLVFIMTLMPSTIVPTIAEDVGGFIENALAEDIGVYEYHQFSLDTNSEKRTFSFGDTYEGKYVMMMMVDSSEYDSSSGNVPRTTIKLNDEEIYSIDRIDGARYEFEISYGETDIFEFDFENLEGVNISIVIREIDDLYYFNLTTIPYVVNVGETGYIVLELPEDRSLDSEISVSSNDSDILRIGEAERYINYYPDCGRPVVQFELIPVSEGTVTVYVEYYGICEEYNIEVKPLYTISADIAQPLTGVVNAGIFCPAETGYYNISTRNTVPLEDCTPDHYSFAIWQKNSDGIFESYENYVSTKTVINDIQELNIEAYFEAGKEYKITDYSSADSEYEMIITLLTAPTSDDVAGLKRSYPNEFWDVATEPFDAYCGSSNMFVLNITNPSVIARHNDLSITSSNPEKVVPSVNIYGENIITLTYIEVTTEPVYITVRVNDTFDVVFCVNVKDTPTLSLNESKTVNNAGQFYFTPDEDGIYCIKTSNTVLEEGLNYCHLLEVPGEAVFYSGNREISVEAMLNAGSTYRISTEFNEQPLYYSSTGSYDITVTKLNMPTEATIKYDWTETVGDGDTISSVVGKVKELELDFGDRDDVCKYFNDVSWSIEDDTVAYIEGYSEGCRIHFESVGETVLTVTINDTIVLNINIVVEAAEKIELDTPKRIDESYVSFLYTPKETGVYCIKQLNLDESEDFFYTHEISVVPAGFEIEEQTFSDFFDDGKFYEVRLEEGTEYLINSFILSWFEDPYATPYDFVISKLNDPEIIFFGETEDLYVGSIERIPVLCEGENCAQNANAYNWTSDNTDIIYFDPYGQAHCVGTGITNIKVELANNPSVSASATVRVKAPKEISLGETVSGQDTTVFEFTPNVSGVYLFTTDNIETTTDSYCLYSEISCVDDTREDVWGEGDVEYKLGERIYYFEVPLEANTTYLFKQSFDEEDFYRSKQGTYDVSVKKLKNPTSAELVDDQWTETDNYAVPGLCGGYDVKILGDDVPKCFFGVEWSIDDTSIIEMNSESNTGIGISYLAPGTTKLKAKINNSIVVEKEITVYDDKYTIETGESVSFKTNGGVTAFSFTPEETGPYKFCYEPFENCDGEIIVCDSDYNRIWDIDATRMGIYEAGVEYTVLTYCDKVGENRTMSAIIPKYPESISVSQNPDKTEYYRNNITGEYSVGNNIDLRGMVININWSDGTTTQRRVTQNNMSISGYYLYGEHVIENGQDKIEVSLAADGSLYNPRTQFDISLIDSPVTEIKVIQTPILDSMGYVYDDSGIKVYEVNQNYFLLEIHEGDKVYTNAFNRYYPEMTEYRDDDGSEYPMVRLGYFDEDGNPVFSSEPYALTNWGQLENPWSIGGDNTINITYKGYTISHNVELIENPYKAMEVVQVPTNINYANNNFDYLEAMNELGGYWDGYVPTIKHNLDGLTLRLYKTEYDEIDNPSAYDDIEVGGLWTNETQQLNGYEMYIGPAYSEAYEMGESSTLLVSYLGFKSQFELNSETKNVAEVEVIEQPELNLYLDDNRMFEIEEWDDGTTIFVHPKLSMLEGLKFRYKYDDGTYSKTFELPNIGDKQDGIFDGQYFGFFRTYFGLSEEEALNNDTIYFLFENQLIPVKVHVEKEKPVKGFDVVTEDELSITVSADSKENAINTASKQLSDEELAAIEEPEAVFTTNVVVSTAKNDELYQGILEVAKLDNQEVAMKLDIGVSYNINGGENTDIHETDGEIAITIEIPEKLRGRESYKVYREHDYDGEKVIETIEPTISSDGKYLTFKSDKFSNYAISAEKSDIHGSVIGEISSFNSKNSARVELLQDGEVKYHTTIAFDAAIGAQTQKFEIANVIPGTYDLVVKKVGHLDFVATGLKVDETGLDLTSNEDYSDIKLINLIYFV